jgi:hypothetical protein
MALALMGNRAPAPHQKSGLEWPTLLAGLAGVGLTDLSIKAGFGVHGQRVTD